MAEKNRVHIDFAGKWSGAAPALAGLGFFLHCVYYFGFTNLIDCGFFAVVFQMLLPMALLAALTVLWQMKRYDAFHVYAVMGGVYSILMLFRTFSYSSVIIMILEILLYLAGAAVCFLAASGKLREYRYMTWVLMVPAVFRLVIDLFQYVFTLKLFALIADIAAVCGLAAFAFVAKSLKTGK